MIIKKDINNIKKLKINYNKFNNLNIDFSIKYYNYILKKKIIFYYLIIY
jgi:hypothetical protein